MIKTREIIQEEAFQALKKADYKGVVVLSTGTGKSKVAVRCMIEGNFKNILITSPRTNLKQSWMEQLDKWYPEWGTNDEAITIQNIQTAYKWVKEDISQYDLIVVDEIHVISVEMVKYLQIAQELGISVIGLTATPFKENDFKRDVLYKLFPIVYEYYLAEDHGIVNKCRYIVYEYELTDEFKVLAGTKDKKWLVGEKTQYEYLTKQYENGKMLMAQEGADDYFTQSLLWMKSGNPSQRIAGSTFFRAIKNRKDFLWSLESSVQIALKLSSKILYAGNKLLLFSELTKQANKLSGNVIHSNVTSKSKDTAEANKHNLHLFNIGVITNLASCNSLTLGLNLVGANWAIFESYSSSNVNSVQKAGRLHRLGLDEVANIIILKPKNTQMETWFNKAFDFVAEFETINNVNDLKL
jgi:superfamily II DNA or RNA helicase